MESPFIYIAIPIIAYIVLTIICLYFSSNYLFTAKEYGNHRKRMKHLPLEIILIILISFIPILQVVTFVVWLANDTDSFLKKKY